MTDFKFPPKRQSWQETKPRIDAILNFCADLTDPKPRTQEETWALVRRANELGIKISEPQ